MSSMNKVRTGFDHSKMFCTKKLNSMLLTKYLALMFCKNNFTYHFGGLNSLWSDDVKIDG